MGGGEKEQHGKLKLWNHLIEVYRAEEIWGMQEKIQMNFIVYYKKCASLIKAEFKESYQKHIKEMFVSKHVSIKTKVSLVRYIIKKDN